MGYLFSHHLYCSKRDEQSKKPWKMLAQGLVVNKSNSGK